MQSTISEKKEYILGFSLAAIAAILWSFIGPLSKEILQNGVPPLTIAFWRACIGGACFGIHALFSKKLIIKFRDASIFFLFGFIGVGLLFSSLQISIQLSGAATAMLLLYTAPAWVAVMARVLFNEYISLQKLLAICIALFGVIFICFSGGSLPESSSALGIVCGLISGFTYALHFPFYSWWKKKHSVATIYTYMLLGGAVSLLPFCSFNSEFFHWSIWKDLLALALLTNYIAYVAFAESLKRISQIQSAVIGNIEPLLNAMWVCLFFGEDFTFYGWLGCFFIILAVFFLTLEKKTVKV